MSKPSSPSGASHLQSRRRWARAGSRAGVLWVFLLGLLGPAHAQPAGAQDAAAARSGDFIVAVVNQELVTNSEVQQRVARMEQEAAHGRGRVPPRDELRQQVLEQLIDELAQLSVARESGIRVDDSELERAVAVVASQNQLTLPQLRERLQTEGIDFARFRDNVRDQLLLERVRERELSARVKVSDTEVEDWVATQHRAAGAALEYNIAQVVIAVPEAITPDRVAQLRDRAQSVLARARAGEDFGVLVKEFSTGSKENGGQLGMRPPARLPDSFVEAVRGLKPGEVAPALVRSGAGFHVLRLVDLRDGNTVVQNHARHILLRTGDRMSQQAAIERLADIKRQVESGRGRFDELAREVSQDGSAAQGGDLGWAGPGQFVPEFEQALARLEPGAVSDPVVSRFGVHLIQLLERRREPVDMRQVRDTARNTLRDQKMDRAYQEWAREVRARAYVELREPPL